MTTFYKNTFLSYLSYLSYFSYLSFFSFLSYSVSAQPSIAWQHSIGTENSDNALQLFKDPQGDLILIGTEPHHDFTGNFRDYLTVVKLDPDGNQIWKTYHDVAFETFNPPVEYGIGDHFFTEEFGQKLINLVVVINNQNYLIKLLENTGTFYTYEQISSPLIDVKPNNDKVYAATRCSYSAACYGPDSLTVQKFDPTPDSIIFNPIKWTFGLKQNIRTTPIQGHYDFDGEDIREDSSGNVFLLVQIERWDFQFCTDCNDAFVDAWCEVFKFSPQGILIKHQRIVTSRAVVSAMRFVSFDEGAMIIRVDDINASNTAIITSVYHVDSNLNVTRTITLDRQYLYVTADEAGDLFTSTNIYDHGNPDIHGESDVLISKFNADGILQWKSYYGGSSFEWPHGLALTGDDLVFLANTSSNDFDVENNNGGQDMWVVRLTENTTSTDPLSNVPSLDIYPNPVADELHVLNLKGNTQIDFLDLQGRILKTVHADQDEININVSGLPSGNYFLRARSSEKVMIGKVVVK